tara:strand:- start:241 stop:462 length:222 start_codon:yes stop_codon:yes gene_type:complete
MKMKKILEWVVARLKEKTTWAGIISAGGLLGLNLAPELWTTVEGFVLAAIALVAVLTKEEKVPALPKETKEEK